jgi:hypothetical protein
MIFSVGVDLKVTPTKEFKTEVRSRVSGEMALVAFLAKSPGLNPRQDVL